MSSPEVREPTLLVLAALGNGEKHGSAILRDAKSVSDGRARLRAGTLYTALDRLIADDLVIVTRTEVVDGRHRRYYKVTDDGVELLNSELARLQARPNWSIRRLLSGQAAR